MTVSELVRALSDYGDHLPVKVELDHTAPPGQYEVFVSDGKDDEDGVAIVAFHLEEW
jgi:hypothetical protein